MILGLDLSTSIVGICVVDLGGEIRLQDYVDLRKEKTFFDKITCAKERILSVVESGNIEEIWIEQITSGISPRI